MVKIEDEKKKIIEHQSNLIAQTLCGEDQPACGVYVFSLHFRFCCGSWLRLCPYIGLLSYGGSYTIVYLSVCPAVQLFISLAFFSGMGQLFFLILFRMVNNWNIQKRSEPFFRKIRFYPNLGKKDLNWPQIGVLWIFWKILLLVFPTNNLKW